LGVGYSAVQIASTALRTRASRVIKSMDTVNMVLCGLGGQGILFMTKILAQAALDQGLNVMGAETHGMAQRGGSVVSHLRLGDVEGSLVRPGSAHFLLALEENEAYRNIPFLGRGGKMFANASGDHFPRQEVRPYLEKLKIIHRSVPAGKLAVELGAPMALNLALLGFFSAFEEAPFGRKELRETIEKVSPPRFRTMNLDVFDAGLASASPLKPSR
jgi:indolepyruvate ferredoxin oxidoreductase beta subunit